ncbi:MAG: riboflavin kinase [Clostridia bacterium]|nr:riboflavin kinase [Clostridia bacterium]
MSGLPFGLEGRVVPGKQLGTRLGFPTANIAYDPLERDWPQEGVYVGVAQVEGEARAYVSILNQGRHPTAPGGMPTVEAHLLGHPPEALYGKKLMLSYRAYLRAEMQFPSLDELKAQLSRDRLSALHWAEENAPQLLEPIGNEGAKDGAL